MNKLTEIKECVNVLNNESHHSAGLYYKLEKRLAANGLEYVEYLISLLEEKDKALTSITEITWCKHNIPGPEQAIYRTAYKALTSSNNEGGI